MTINSRFSAISFRGAPIALRVALLTIISTELPVTEVGLFGIVQASVWLSSFVLGLEVYVVATRNILATVSLESARIQSENFLGAAILVALSVFVSSCVASAITAEWILLLVGLLVASEYLSSEIDRLLVAQRRNTYASALFFVRSASWVPISILALKGTEADLFRDVLTPWAVASFFSVAAGCVTVDVRRSSYRRAFPWWQSAANTAAPLFLAAAAVRLLLLGDRYALASVATLIAVGAYTIYASILGVMNTLLSVALHNFEYPVIFASPRGQLRERVLRYERAVVVWSAGAGLLLAVVAHAAANFLGGSYEVYFWSFAPALFVAYMFYNLSMPAHYGLLALRLDSEVARSQWLALGFAGIIWLALAGGGASIVATPIALAAGMLSLCLVKMRAFRDQMEVSS